MHFCRFSFLCVNNSRFFFFYHRRAFVDICGFIAELLDVLFHHSSGNFLVCNLLGT